MRARIRRSSEMIIKIRAKMGKSERKSGMQTRKSRIRALTNLKGLLMAQRTSMIQRIISRMGIKKL